MACFGTVNLEQPYSSHSDGAKKPHAVHPVITRQLV